MSDFVSTPGQPVAGAETPIAGSGFFPDVDPARVRLAQRIPDAITPARLRAAVIAAMLWVDGDEPLAAWALAQIEDGHATLSAVPARQIDGRSVLVHHYFRAIGCQAKAELVERTRDTDTTNAADRAAQMLDCQPGELRRDASHAIRAILGRTPTVVELI
jgi:hypothetical protein